MAASAKRNNQNSLNSFLNTNFNILVVILVLIFLALAYFLVVKPKFEITLVAIKENITQQEQFYQSQRQKLTDLQAAATLYHQISDSDIKKVNDILPDEYAKEKLFGELEDIIMQQGLLLTSIQLEKIGENVNVDEPMAAKDERLLAVPNSQHIGIIKANISLSSTDYAALKNLLPLLENNLQLVDIDTIHFDPEAKTANISLSTYYFK